MLSTRLNQIMDLGWGFSPFFFFSDCSNFWGSPIIDVGLFRIRGKNYVQDNLMMWMWHGLAGKEFDWCNFFWGAQIIWIWKFHPDETCMWSWHMYETLQRKISTSCFAVNGFFHSLIPFVEGGYSDSFMLSSFVREVPFRAMTLKKMFESLIFML